MKYLSVSLKLFLSVIALSSSVVFASGTITKQCDSALSDGTKSWAMLKQSATVTESSNQFAVVLEGRTLISPILSPLKDGGMGAHDGPVLYFKNDKGFAIKGEGTPILVMTNCSVRM